MAAYQDLKMRIQGFCDKTVHEANHMDKNELIVGLTQDSYSIEGSLNAVYKWELDPYQLRKEYIREKLLEAYDWDNNFGFMTRARLMFIRYIRSFHSDCIRKIKSKDIYYIPQYRRASHDAFTHDLACIIMRFNHDQGNELPENQTYIEQF